MDSKEETQTRLLSEMIRDGLITIEKGLGLFGPLLPRYVLCYVELGIWLSRRISGDAELWSELAASTGIWDTLGALRRFLWRFMGSPEFIMNVISLLQNLVELLPNSQGPVANGRMILSPMAIKRSI